MACNKRGEKWRSNDVKITENVTFSNLFLPDRTLQGLQRCGFEVPSPVQLKAIPWGRCGCDLIVQAKSGTGKTCVMAVIALEGLVENSYTQALMLAPTREIAVQIRDVIRLMGSAFPNLQCHSFIGGVPVSEDHAKLSGCQIAVGTPGRIKHLIVENCLDTRAIRLFVLDEADVLLEKSFIDDINWIYSSLPSSKQVIALSATYPRSLAELLKRYMKNPKHLDINSKDQGLIGISQFYKNTQFHPIPDFADASKFSTLLDILSTITFSQCMIFCKQQARVQDIAENLNDKGFSICGISSSLDQADRLRIIAKLKHFQCRILVSTDLTARGIDAENVNLVVNYDFPNTPEAYLHRMGRAGRYGTSGIVISLISSDSDRNRLKSFQQHYHFTIDELPEPIPANLWGLIFERKFMVSPAMENGKAPGEKGISTETVEAFGCLVTPAIENSNHSVAENFEDNVNSDCVKNNLENFCNFPEANNMGNLNKNCKASETSKIINVLQNYEGLPEDFKGSGDFLLKRSEEEKVELNEVLNNKDSNTWYKNDVKQQQTENLCSPAVAKQQESSKNDHKYQHCKLDTQDEMCFDDHHSSADLLLNMKYDTLRDTDEKQCYQITVDNTETFSNRNGINEDSDLLSQKNDSDVQLKQNVHFDMSCIAKTYLEDGEVKYESKSFNVQTEGNFGENLSLLKACSITGDKENCNEMTVIAIKPTSSENKLKENDEILPQSSTCHQHIFPYTSYDTLERWKSYFEFGKSECDIDSPEKMSVTLSHIFNTSDTKETRLYATYEELLQDVTGTETLDLSNFIKCKEYDINNHLIHGGMDHVEKNILNNVEESVVANLNFKSSLITKGQPDELNINVSQNTNFSEIDMKNRNLDGALKMSLNDTLTPVYNKSSCIDANKNAGDVSKSTGNPKKIPSHCHNVIPSKNNLVLYSAEKDGNTNSSKSVSERKIGSNANELRHHTWLKKSNFGKTSDILPYFNSNEYSSPNECSKNLSYNEYVYAINGLIPCTIINTQNGKKTSKLNSFNKNHQFQQKGYEKHQVEQKIVSENENGVCREVFEEKKKDIKHGNWKKIPKDTLTEKKCSVFSTRKVATDVLMNKKPEYLRKDMGNEVKEYSKKRESQNMSWFPKCQKRELPSRNFNSSNFFPSGMQSKQSQNREKTKKYNLSSECSSSQPPCLKARGHLCCGERKYEEIRRKVCCCFHHVHCANSKVSFCCGNPLHEFDEIQSCLKCNIQKHEEAQRKVHCCHHRHHKSNITSACSCHLTQCSRENKNFNATQMVKCYRHFYEQWYYLCELSNWHC